MAKKKGKSKKGLSLSGPQIITTTIIRRERIKVLCPRMGDSFTRAKLVEEILEDVAERILLKASARRSNMINLSCMRIGQLPDLFMLAPDLKSLVDINLSRNNLFDSDQVFEVSFKFVHLFFFPFCILCIKIDSSEPCASTNYAQEEDIVESINQHSHFLFPF